MPQSMLCTQCYQISVPETVLSGSDFKELVAWCCLALPGFVYCSWRHWNRAKACPSCGSHVLMRESRASLARRDPQGQSLRIPTRIRSESDPVSWPDPFQTPRGRLRQGLSGALPATLALLALLCAAFDWLPPVEVASLGGLALAFATVWVVKHAVPIARLQQRNDRT